MRFSRRLLAFLVLAPACGGVVASQGGDSTKPTSTEGSAAQDAAAPTNTQPSSSASASPAPTSSGTTSPTSTPPSEGPDAAASAAVFCGQTLGVHPGVCSAAEFQTLVVGSWRLCSKPSAFGTNEDGLAIDADGTWHKLVATDGGALTPQTGAGAEGTWSSAIQSSAGGCIDQLIFEISDGDGGIAGGIGPFPVLSAADDHMQLDNEGVYLGDYVRAL